MRQETLAEGVTLYCGEYVGITDVAVDVRD